MYQHNCWQKLRAEVNKVSVSLITRDIAKHGDQNCQAFKRSPLWLFFPFDSHPGLTWFTCYSLNRLDSRLTAIEQNLMLKSTPYQHANGATIKITSENAPGSGWKTTDQIVKRDISSPSICSKCRTVCSNSNTQQNVSYCSVLLLVTTFLFIFSL